MKKFAFILAGALLFIGTSALAQDLPLKGAKLVVTDTELSSSTTSVDVSLDVELVRSKRARKAKFQTPRVSGLSDITVDVQETATDQYAIKLTGDNIAPGNYIFVVSSPSSSYHKVTGTTFTLSVGGTKVAEN